MLLTVASLRRQLGLDARHLVGESGRQRLDGFLLRLLPQPLVAGEDGVDGGEERRLDVRAPGGDARAPILGGRSGFRATARGRSLVPVS